MLPRQIPVKYIQFPDIYKYKILFDTKLNEKILDEVFSQYSEDKKIREKMKFGLNILYAYSDLFARIVNNSILLAIERSPRDVGYFKHLAFKLIKQESRNKEKDIRNSIAIKNSQMMRNHDSLFRWLMKRLRSGKLSEGYSINELWNEFFTKAKRDDP